MTAKACIYWVLGVAMVIASVDAIPDPPAVNPHTVTVVSRLCEWGGGAYEQHLSCDWSSFSSHLRTRWVALTSVSEPSLSRDWIVLTGQAADTSPPLALSQNS
jgi:hypothetical protein